LEAGDTYRDFVAVRNFGTRPLTVSLYGHDAQQTVEDDFQLQDEG